MLLRNFYNALVYDVTGKTYASDTYGAGSLGVKDKTGAKVPAFSVSTRICSNSTSLDKGIVFGTGTNPVTFDDYQMGSIISSGITKSNIVMEFTSASYNASTLKWTFPFKCDITNTTASPITITEVGYFDVNTISLLWRELLATPITISAGQRVSFTQDIVVQFPG